VQGSARQCKAFGGGGGSVFCRSNRPLSSLSLDACAWLEGPPFATQREGADQRAGGQPEASRESEGRGALAHRQTQHDRRARCRAVARASPSGRQSDCCSTASSREGPREKVLERRSSGEHPRENIIESSQRARRRADVRADHPAQKEEAGACPPASARCGCPRSARDDACLRGLARKRRRASDAIHAQRCAVLPPPLLPLGVPGVSGAESRPDLTRRRVTACRCCRCPARCCSRLARRRLPWAAPTRRRRPH